MNPANPYLNHHSFTFLYQNPNPNPNPNRSPSFPFPPFPAPPLPSILTTPNPPQNPNPNPPLPPNTTIPDAISALKHSIHLAQTTLQSISRLLNLPCSDPPKTHLSPCPFNPNHLLPVHSLFLHFIRCRSSPAALSPSLLDSLRYPKSLLDPSNQTRFPESDADLCLSLDEYIGFGGSNFFYKDCPGVVRSSDQDAARRTFTLPAVLSVECANFDSDGDNKEIKEEVPEILLLPSELWALRREIKAWSDYPLSYSYTVLRAISCLKRMDELDALNCVIGNSPRYGIVIDVPMRDHVFVILKLCLKVIWREASKSLEFVTRGELGSGENLKLLCFFCPHLVEVLMWLALQLSVLYGEQNGKLFAIEMLAQCLLSAGSGSLLFMLGGKEERDLDAAESSWSEGKMFVSQVAAAIAALHERSLLEERIKELLFGIPPSKVQLINEHLSVSTRAYEERAKRLDYRALLEHDGLLWQQSRNQDTNKNKTREELLAEERDYKRRRMSYRGKKVKRTTTEVMRDIIEEHMEEIKQAGGIGCLVKGAQETVSSSAYDKTADVDELKGSGRRSVETNRSHSHVYERQVHTGFNIASKRLEDALTKDQSGMSSGMKYAHQHQSYEHHVSNNSWEDRKRSISRDNHDSEYRSRSPHGYRSHSQSRERHGRQREQEQDDVEGTRNKYERNGSLSSHSSKHRDNRSFSFSSKLSQDSSTSKCDWMQESKDRHGHWIQGKRKSGSAAQSTFHDRYDPSGSYDSYEETSDASLDSKYIRLDKLYGQTHDVKHHKLQRLDKSSKGHCPDHQKKS
ncbi:U11/U12 small nuclear ribonucleoprotein 48 kDa protein-like isoform X1 [Magnolia sinica]|uniref:U11/U12 small nuclear ribonucleoprotein 48 kDa protein-like isoform X1 n=1 Tax=Magnolia sinica TaxID=86752 RepID=UPI00265B3D34|nr:U11/U12 small nuclear ribonucleoprotein 48 kDa protein-like isoform X1 [Magnolia sinica]XP_058072312.1 U11/U12 small nuclear ribonucleoprotein 48 kDa protein-like isoform X1 [Magnolia sinica]XP_058072314.1 U11/U12 small nuclear ribonucleoprotein 48 kDa protein-like isoform X1 [Magnolia sinica]XP_058072315.1 U11/U12 small nuclear ribonucleoprotein 48 kDa protein-like isoform X1 [Magnolia sinica]XP_058072316.1 U11/U12 small nuclear ribonucleoprotein 48 kDa protein-like isoform X1 [Magnolia sin